MSKITTIFAALAFALATAITALPASAQKQAMCEKTDLSVPEDDMITQADKYDVCQYLCDTGRDFFKVVDEGASCPPSVSLSEPILN